MECYSVIAHWTEDAAGPSIEAWANFHGPFSMVPVIASALGLPMAQLRLHAPTLDDVFLAKTGRTLEGEDEGEGAAAEAVHA